MSKSQATRHQQHPARATRPVNRHRVQAPLPPPPPREGPHVKRLWMVVIGW